MRKATIYTSVLFSLLVLFTQCKKNDTTTPDTYNPTYLSLITPTGWENPTKPIFAGNPLTEEGFQLGRKLFYEGKLSKDDNFPCASCHQQSAAFATFDHQFSHGFGDTFTSRNSPGIFNLAWYKELHWDGRFVDFEKQPIAPITAPNEMAETISNVLTKLKKDTSYARLFKKAFGDANITEDRLLKAITQFVSSIQSYNSKYDKVKNGKASFTISEQNGYTVFKNNCAACHTEPLFTDNKYHYTGLPIDPILLDNGRMKVTNNKSDSLLFRTPSLRNVKPSFPYMHDGRLYTLSMVIDHYKNLNTSDILLDPILKTKINISGTEKLDLLAFLETLTDHELISNTRFAQP